MRFPTSHLLSPNEASSVRTGFHPTELLVEKNSWKSPIIQVVSKKTDCSPQTDSKAPLLKTTPAQLIEYEMVTAGVYIEPSSSFSRVYDIERYSVGS